MKAPAGGPGLAWSSRDRAGELAAARAVTVTRGDRAIRGTARGVDNEGSLLVQVDSGRMERFRAGEVTLAKDAT